MPCKSSYWWYYLVKYCFLLIILSCYVFNNKYWTICNCENLLKRSQIYYNCNGCLKNQKTSSYLNMYKFLMKWNVGLVYLKNLLLFSFFSFFLDCISFSPAVLTASRTQHPCLGQMLSLYHVSVLWEGLAGYK